MAVTFEQFRNALLGSKNGKMNLLRNDTSVEAWEILREYFANPPCPHIECAYCYELERRDEQRNAENQRDDHNTQA